MILAIIIIGWLVCAVAAYALDNAHFNRSYTFKRDAFDYMGMVVAGLMAGPILVVMLSFEAYADQGRVRRVKQKVAPELMPNRPFIKPKEFNPSSYQPMQWKD